MIRPLFDWTRKHVGTRCQGRIFTAWPWVAARLVLAMLGWVASPSVDAQSVRGLGAEARPLTSAERESVGLPKEGSAGLFVGVGKFDATSGLGDLRFTPDDAVALAHLFVVELELLPAKNTRVALGGEPRSQRGRELARILVSKGVRRVGAERTQLLDVLAEVSDLGTAENGLVVMSFSSHGFEEKGKAYVMPSDGRRRFVESTGVSLQTVKDTLRDSKANKKLLFLDACRETIGSDTRGEERMRGPFQQALSAAEGFGVIASCSVGQLSWESPELEQGVFTHFLLEGIRGGAMSPVNDGFIRLGTVSSYAAKATRDWVAKNKNEVQEPWFEGELARGIPLAVDQRVQQQLEAQRAAEAQLNQRRGHALDLLTEARKSNRDLLTGKLEDEVTAAVQSLRGLPLNELLEQLEDLADPKPARVRSFLAWWKARPATGVPVTSLQGLLIRNTNSQVITVPRPTNILSGFNNRPVLNQSVAMILRGLDGQFCEKLRQVLDARSTGFESLKGAEAKSEERIPIQIGGLRVVTTYPEWLSRIQFTNALHATIMESMSNKARTLRLQFPSDSPEAKPTFKGLVDGLANCLGDSYVKTQTDLTSTTSVTVTFTPRAGGTPPITVRSSKDSMMVTIPAEISR